MDPALRHHGDETDSEADAHGSATNEHDVVAAHAVHHAQAHEVASVVNGAEAAIQAAAAVAAASAWATAAAATQAVTSNTSDGSLDMDGKSGSSKMRRAAWSQDEEARLTDLANRYANAGQSRMCWRLIAQELGTGRTSKQCREHYLNSLRPNMKKGQWTQREEYIIAREHAKIGSHWCIIAKKLPGRTDNSIKNFYNATVRSKAMNKHESFLWIYVNKVHQCGMETKQALQVATEIWTQTVSQEVAREVLSGAPEDGAEALMLLSSKRKELASLLVDDPNKRVKLDGGLLSPGAAAAAVMAAAGSGQERTRQELLQTLGIMNAGGLGGLNQQQQGGQVDMQLLQQQMLLQQLLNAATGSQAGSSAGGGGAAGNQNVMSLIHLLAQQQQQQQQQQSSSVGLLQQMGLGNANAPSGGGLLSLLGVQDGAGGQMQPADAAAAVAAAAAAASGVAPGMTHIELHDIKQEGKHGELHMHNDSSMLEAAAAAAAAQVHAHAQDQHVLHGQGHMIGDQQQMLNAAALQALGDQFQGQHVPVDVLLASFPQNGGDLVHSSGQA